MGVANIILIIVGGIVILFGIIAIINPTFSRLINVPGGPRLKASIAIIVGTIILISSIFYQLPG